MLHETKKEENNTFSVSKRNKLDWRDVISLKHSAEEIWDTETANEKRDWGKLLHLVLSRIHYAEQKDEVIERMYQLGKFSSDDNEKLREIINELLTSYKVKHFFSGDWEVKTENEILMENGKTYIPDRLLFSKTTDEIIVIDYKTGIKKDIHETQITEYSNALKLMGMKNVKRVLIYTSDEIKVEYL
jgi:ATP-dependent exoDNAse (exonuclease V) beta subunit